MGDLFFVVLLLKADVYIGKYPTTSAGVQPISFECKNI
jgi:hypothetical protein